jgi:hypothetical protein
MIGRKKTDGVAQFTADAKEVTAQLYGFHAVYGLDDYLVICGRGLASPGVWRAAGSRFPSIEPQLVCRSATLRSEIPYSIIADPRA